MLSETHSSLSAQNLQNLGGLRNLGRLGTRATLTSPLWLFSSLAALSALGCAASEEPTLAQTSEVSRPSTRGSSTAAIEESYPSPDTPLPLPNRQVATSTIAVAESFVLESVRVDVSLTHSSPDGLQLVLVSPAGTQIRLYERSFTHPSNPSRTYVVPSHLAGELSTGSWQLRISHDEIGGGSGTLTGWTLHLSDQPSSASFHIEPYWPEEWMVRTNAFSLIFQLLSLEGFGGQVDFSLVSTPPIAGQFRFGASSVVPSWNVSIFGSATCTAAPGTYDFAITGQSGALTKTEHVKITLLPEGSSKVHNLSFHPPREVPDNSPTGISSVVPLSSGLQSSLLRVGVVIDHPAIGELTVQLVSPSGQTVTLHDRSGGDDDNLFKSYDVPQLTGGNVTGDWTLRVIDHVAGNVGTLQRWILYAADTRRMPTADFSVSTDRLTVTMQDLSSDVVGCEEDSVTGWRWDFGDGSTSTAQHPTHTYASAGTYPVTLTVTDNDGNSASVTREVTVARPAPALRLDRIVRNRATFEFVADLSWSGAQGALVELHRNDALVDLPDNDGAHRDSFRSYQTSYVWKLCELRSAFCSNQVSVVFANAGGAEGPPREATVTFKGADGSLATRVMRIGEE